MKLLTEAEIRQMCPNATNVVVTGDVAGLTVGLKVGLFAQATAISVRMDEDTQRRKVRDLYMDLVMMNKREEQQQREAAEEARGASR